jgi:uncharacterized cupredoxin-like copper-binding protein
MTLVSAGYGTMTAGLAYLAYVVGLFVQAADDPDVAALIPIFVSITSIVVVVGAVSVVWSGARHRRWFWSVAALPGLVILLMSAPYVAYDISHPANTEQFLAIILLLAGGLAVILGGVAAFLEVGRGRPVWTRTGRAGWVSITVVAALVGAAATSALAGLTSPGGTGVAEEPTVTGVVTAEKTTFVATSLHMNNGEVLGLFVINRDTIGHTFDIDSLDIHVQLPPTSTIAVAIKPTGSGPLEFFCAVPGHREAGMVGTIAVDA